MLYNEVIIGQLYHEPWFIVGTTKEWAWPQFIQIMMVGETKLSDQPKMLY